MNIIKLFHGSNLAVKEIDLSKGNKGKDFGFGFYLNPNKEQANEMAKAKADFLGGNPVVSEFEFNPDLAVIKELNIKIFEDYSEDWAEFVALNRKNRTDIQAHNYDIVIGPIADDKVGVQIRRFVNGYSSHSFARENFFKKMFVKCHNFYNFAMPSR